MAQIRNVALEKLRAGELAVGTGVRLSRTVEIAKMMRAAGFDWLFVDMEHSAIDLDVAAQICVAAQDAGIAPIVRVPGFEHWHASRLLDSGAQGIVAPHVDDAATAARIADNCRYPPEGKRSIAGALPQLDFAALSPAETIPAVNAATLVVVMLETPTAILNAEEIAAVPGVDALLIGTNDLSMEMGIPGQLDHADIAAAYERVIAACRAHGKHPGMGGVYTPDLMRRYVDMGMRLILSGNDFSFLMSAARAQAAAVKSMT